MKRPKASETQGGMRGHIFRRLIHVSSIFVPLIYYFYFPSFWIVIFFLLVILLFESLRLLFKWELFGQRHYEVQKISSFAWSTFAVALVLIFSPAASYGIPIIWSWALGDPLMGELRAWKVNQVLAFIIGIILVILIWLAGYFFFGIPWWLAFIMGPLVILSERSSFQHFDDSVPMMLLPLILVWILF